VPPGGAFDRESMMLANALLQRPLDAPVLELVVMGAVLDVLEPCNVAVVGANSNVSSWATRQRMNSVIPLQAGDSLSIGPAAGGARVYVACDAPTPAPLKLGARMKAGQVIGDPEALSRAQAKGFPTKPEERPLSAVRHLAEPPFSLFRGALRVLPGPQAHMINPQLLQSSMFVATPNCDRAGLRLDGPQLGEVEEVPSEPACTGAIQVTPSSQLLMLGPDGPTIGGYPKIAVVIDADRDRIAQIVPGQKIWFEIVTGEQAAELNRERDARLDGVVRQLRVQ
jgi:allophanate hydrolase subunit 2